MDISTEKEDWLNSRASYYGGYVSFATAHRNKAAEMFYRDAIDRLQQKFISSVFRQLKQAYFIVPAENAKGNPVKRKPSVASVRIALNRIKGGMMDLFQDTVEKIVFRYVRRVTKEGRQEIVTALERFTGNRLAMLRFDPK